MATAEQKAMNERARQKALRDKAENVARNKATTYTSTTYDEEANKPSGLGSQFDVEYGKLKKQMGW